MNLLFLIADRIYDFTENVDGSKLELSEQTCPTENLAVDPI